MRSVLWSALSAGIETLRLNPLRTLLSTLGIIMGVGALVSVLSLGDGMQAFAREQIERTTDLQSIAVSPVLFRTVEGQRFPRTDVVELNAAHVDSIQRLSPDSTFVSLMLQGQAIVNTPQDTTPRAAAVIGTLETVAVEIGNNVSAGRLFTRDEVDNKATVVVLTQPLARRLDAQRADSDWLGDTVFFQGKPRVVVGLIDSIPGRDGPIAFMPVSVAMEAMAPALVGRAAIILVKAQLVEQVPAIRDSIKTWLERSYGSNWRERVSISTNDMRVAQVQQGMMLFKLFMGALTGISLLVGGIGIMNVLLASVVERTREIGIRRATGALKRHLLLQFLAESVVITSLGSLVGIALGVSVAYAVTAIMRSVTQAQVQAGFSFSTFAVAVVASVAVGVAFGMYPALRASRLSPIDAIRHE